MPALMTHHIFGEKAVRTLDDGLVEGQEELLSYLIGCQGPDPFFFRASLSGSARELHALASDMHCRHVIGTFQALVRGIDRLPKPDQRIGRAYALGFLAHYALDSYAHPFIYAQQFALCEAGRSLGIADAGDEVHGVIESQLDSWMVWNERHATVMEYAPADELVRPERTAVAGGALMAYVARSVFRRDIGEGSLRRCVADMRFVYRMVEPYGSKRCERVGLLERLVRGGGYSRLAALAHEVVRDDGCPAANLAHEPWEDPCTGEVSQKGFYDLFADALAAYPAMARAFLEGHVEGSFGDIDFDGRPLGPDRL